MSDLASFAVLLIVGSNVARSPIMIMDWTSAEDHRAPEISPQELSSPDGTLHSLERSFRKRWNSNSKLSVPNFNVEITLQGKHEAIAFSPAVTFLCTAPNKDLFNVRKSFGKIEIQLSYLKSSLPKLIVALPNAKM